MLFCSTLVSGRTTKRTPGPVISFIPSETASARVSFVRTWAHSDGCQIDQSSFCKRHLSIPSNCQDSRCGICTAGASSITQTFHFPGRWKCSLIPSILKSFTLIIALHYNTSTHDINSQFFTFNILINNCNIWSEDFTNILSDTLPHVRFILCFLLKSILL